MQLDMKVLGFGFDFEQSIIYHAFFFPLQEGHACVLSLNL